VAQYRRKVEDIFAMEEDIAKENLREIAPKSRSSATTPAGQGATQTCAAYHLYLKGRCYWAKRTEEGLYKGIHSIFCKPSHWTLPTRWRTRASLGYVPLAVFATLP